MHVCICKYIHSTFCKCNCHLYNICVYSCTVRPKSLSCDVSSCMSFRSQAVELGQALVDAKMLEVVTSYEQEFKDDSNAILIPLQVRARLRNSTHSRAYI